MRSGRPPPPTSIDSPLIKRLRSRRVPEGDIRAIIDLKHMANALTVAIVKRNDESWNVPVRRVIERQSRRAKT